MSDSIEAAISSSIASLPGSDASSGGSSSAVADTSTDTSSTDSGTASDTPISDGDTAAAAPVTDPAAPVVDPVAEPVLPPDDTLEGLAKELAGKRDNRIPHSRVVKIAEKAAKDAEVRVRAEVEGQYAQFRTPEFANQQVAMQVADERPEDFLRAMAQADPRYAELLAGAKVLAGSQPAPKQGRTAPVEAPDGDVEPDIQLSDGTLGFSAEATRQREAALVARMQAEFKESMDARWKDVEPLVSRERQTTLRHEAAGRVSQRIAEAEKWPGFTESKEAIAVAINAATQKGQQLSLHDAYIQVVIPKFRSDEATTRARLVADMNKAAASATRIAPASGGKVEAAADGGMDPVESAIRASIAGIR